MAQPEPTDTAVVVYTSGTTGKPKGAELTHIQLYMNADIPARHVGVYPSDVVLTVLPMFHVFGLSSIVNLCVRFGCTLSLVPRFDARTVLAAIERDQCTVFDGVPSYLNNPEATAASVTDGWLRANPKGTAEAWARIGHSQPTQTGVSRSQPENTKRRLICPGEAPFYELMSESPWTGTRPVSSRPTSLVPPGNTRTG